MKIKLFLFTLFFTFLFIFDTSKIYAESKGVGADFDKLSSDGKSFRIRVSNTESDYPKGTEKEVSFVVYQCREKSLSYCDGSPETGYIEGSREDINFSVTLPGFSDPELQIEKSFSKGFNCGRIQVDFVPNPNSDAENYGGKLFEFETDCPEPTQPAAPSNTPTPSSTLTPTPSPTPTRTPTPTPCPSTGCGPTSTPTQTPVPTRVPTGTPTNTPVPSRIPLSPTPLLNQSMCKCDNLQISGLFPGSNAEVTAFAKVEGNDINIAQIPNMSFNFGITSSANPNNVRRIIGPVIKQAEKIESNSSINRYKTTWQFPVPTPALANTVYRAWVDIQCARKTAVNNNPERVVLSASTGNSGDFLSQISSAITNLISGLFGGSRNNNQPPSFSPSPSPTPAPSGRKNLQFQPIYPAKIWGDFCTSLYFQFENLQ